MYYEINVSLNGQHFFATDKRSITNKQALEKVYKVFKEKFSPEDGYDIIVSRIETVGKGDLDTDEWHINPAVNVWVFERNGKIITLKCHIITGEIEATEK